MSLSSKVFALSCNLGFSQNQARTITKIAKRKDILKPLINVINYDEVYFSKRLNSYKSLMNDPVSFYNNNKQITSTDKKILTFNSLSFSYSFSSPYTVIRELFDEVGTVFALEEIYGGTFKELLEGYGDMLHIDSMDEKYKNLVNDLKGNKIPISILDELSEKISFEKRSEILCSYGFDMLTKPNLLDAFYVFFGSKKGEEFVSEWKSNSDKHEKLKDEFEYLIYNNPYLNPGLVYHSLESYGSKNHLESCEYFIKENKGQDRRFANDESAIFSRDLLKSQS